MTPNLQDCQSVTPLLDAYHDGELDGAEKASVEQHLRGCEPCSRSLAEVGKLVTALKSMPTLSPRIDFADKIELLIKEKQSAKPGGDVVNFKKFGWVAVAASVILSVVVGQYLLQHGGTSTNIATVPDISSQNRSSVASKGQAVAGDNQVSKTLQAEELASASGSESIASSNANATVSSITGQPSKREGLTKEVAHASVPVQQPTNLNRRAVSAKMEIASNDGSGTENQTSSATSENTSSGGSAPHHSLVAFYEPETNSIPEELGISTDEDGLYAIKM